MSTPFRDPYGGDPFKDPIRKPIIDPFNVPTVQPIHPVPPLSPIYEPPNRGYPYKHLFETYEVWVVCRVKTTLSLNDTFEVVGVFDTKENAHANAKLGDVIRGPVLYYKEQRQQPFDLPPNMPPFRPTPFKF